MFFIEITFVFSAVFILSNEDENDKEYLEVQLGALHLNPVTIWELNVELETKMPNGKTEKSEDVSTIDKIYIFGKLFKL